MPIFGRQVNKTTAILVRKTQVSTTPSHRSVGLQQLTRLEDELQAVILQAFDNVPDRAYLSVLDDKEGLQYRDIVYTALMKEQPKIEDILLRQLTSTGSAEAIDLSKMLAEQFKYLFGKADALTPTQVAQSFRFDLNSQDALNYARTESGQLITNMADEQRAVMRQVVGQTMTAGATRAGTSSALRTILQDIGTGTEYGRITATQIGANCNGLTRQYEKAVWNRANDIAEDLARRGIEGTKAVEEIRKKTDAYAEKLRKARARTIARTEIIRSAEEGRQQAWEQASKKGLIDKNKATKTWSASPMDVCPICSKLQGKTVPLMGKFSTGIGEVKTPPAHPNCRCTMRLNTAKEPPKTIGTGTQADPFRLEVDSGPPNIDDFPPLPGSDVVTPTPTSTPKPTPKPRSKPKPPEVKPVEIPVAPAVEAPLPASSGAGQALTPSSLDDLRDSVKELDFDRGIELVDSRPGLQKRIGARQQRPTLAGDQAVDAIEEAGRRVDQRVDEIISESGGRQPKQIEAQRERAYAQRNELQQTQSEVEFPRMKQALQDSGFEVDDAIIINDSGDLAVFNYEQAQRIRDDFSNGEFLATIDLPTSGNFRLRAMTEYRERWLDVGNRRAIFGDNFDGSASSISRALRDLSRSESTRSAIEKVQDEILELTRELEEAYTKEVKAIRQALREVRPTLGSKKLKPSAVNRGTSKEVTVAEIESAIDKASVDLPAEWVDNINLERYTVTVSKRGSQNTSRKLIQTSTRSPDTTILHEFTHAAEAHTTRLSRANDAFVARQSRNGEEQLVGLKKATGGSYDVSEVAIEDEYGDWYAGRWYGGRDGTAKQEWLSAFHETLPRGMESLFRYDTMLSPFRISGAYRRFVLGTLALV
jgi:hypothetical protein